jgi:hypothetical protein
MKCAGWSIACLPISFRILPARGATMLSMGAGRRNVSAPIDRLAPSTSVVAVVIGAEKLRASTDNRAGHRSRRDLFDFRASVPGILRLPLEPFSRLAGRIMPVR